jgi:hypothetical protein
MPPPNVLDYFDVSVEYLSQVVFANPSLRGMILGYLAEAKLREILSGHGRATALRKDDDHDRKKKGDLVASYQGFEFKIEVKSLQTNTIAILEAEQTAQLGRDVWVRKMLKQAGPGTPNPAYGPVWERDRLMGRFQGQFQCDASDRRTVTFPDQSTLETTNLQVGEFHILAAGLFGFREKWDFAFALNRDLPRSTNRNYSPYHRDRLITSMIPITWPAQPPFTLDVYDLLDTLVVEERAKANAVPVAPAPPSPSPGVSPTGKRRKKKP